MSGYRSGDFTEAAAVGAPVFSQPFPGVNATYVLTQEFMILIDEFEPLALDTAHPDYPEFMLVEESPVQDVGNGIGRWTRTYAKVPDTYEEAGGNYSYNFIGFIGEFGINVTETTGRERFTRTVPCKVERAFYHEANFEDVPVVEEQRYLGGAGSDIDVDYLADSPPLVTATDPSRTEYDTLVAGEEWIAVERSNVTRWMGNIWVRETTYVKAI